MRKRYPVGEKLVVIPAAATQVSMPASVMTMPVTCRAVGRFFRISADAISEITGMHATKTPHSVDVVRLMPSVSPRK